RFKQCLDVVKIGIFFRQIHDLCNIFKNSKSTKYPVFSIYDWNSGRYYLFAIFQNEFLIDFFSAAPQNMGEPCTGNDIFYILTSELFFSYTDNPLSTFIGKLDNLLFVHNDHTIMN